MRIKRLSLLALSLAAALAFALAGCSSGGTNPPAPFKIIFYSDRDGKPGMYKMDAEGKNVELVVESVAGRYYYMAALSHDRRRIAYPTGGDILIFDVNGQELQTLDPGADIYAQYVNWSPDDEHLVFSSTSGNIYTISLENETPVLLGSGYYPDWGPGGIVCSVGGSLYTINPSTKESKALMNGDSEIRGNYPSWSPTGDRISYVYTGTPRGLKVINAEGGEPIMELDGDIYYNNIWTPDGDRIVFTFYDSNYEIYSVAADDASDAVNLTNNDNITDMLIYT